MTQEEALIKALKILGGKGTLDKIYPLALKALGKEGANTKASFRKTLQKHPASFKSFQRGVWELSSYQEELAIRDKRITELEAEVEALKNIPKEDDFVKRFVEETKRFYKHERKKADAIRQIIIKVGRQDAEGEIDAWMDGKQTKKVEKRIVQKISNSQVFNGSITKSEFNGGESGHEG